MKTEQDGNWQDMTNKVEHWDNRHYGQVNISDNGIVYVKVTGHDEKVYEESRYIECNEDGKEFFTIATQDENTFFWLSANSAAAIMYISWTR